MTNDPAKEITESTTGDVVVSAAPLRRAYAVSTTTSPCIALPEEKGGGMPGGMGDGMY